jgi:hypothetical protein
MFRDRMRLQTASTPKKRDGWDYAEIVSRFVSGIVIAFLGIFIPATLQNSQIAIQKNEADSRLRLEQSRADNERVIKQAELTSALIESLASDTPMRREIALVALRSAAPADVYERVLLTLLKNDKSTDVRLAALSELSSSVQPLTAATLFELANNRQYDPSERNQWLVASRTISLRSELPPEACIYLAVAPGYMAFESLNAGGGYFTTALVEDLKHTMEGRAADKSAQAFGLALSSRLLLNSNETMKPFIYCGSKAAQYPIVSSGPGHKIVAVVVGIDHYEHYQNASLRYAKSDAARVAALIKAQAPHSNQVLPLSNEDATAEHIRGILQQARELVRPDDTFIFFFAGHGLADRTGYLEGLQYDYPLLSEFQSRGIVVTYPRPPDNGQPADDAPVDRGPMNVRTLKTYLETFDARLKLLIFDTCYPDSLKQAN